MSSKIRRDHLDRSAYVYLRQSTLEQVMENRQSTERQYALADQAVKLGWDRHQVTVIDEDLGRSGASAEKRTGFQRLVAEVSLGNVGAIFAIEVSRLARSSADWHRLLDFSALSQTLIVDDDGVYDPNDFNDRLVLGLKGTMSEAERHMMRLRMNGAKLHKAQKGELAFVPPTGLVFDKAGVLTLEPDEQVRKAIRLLFERFRIDGSARAVQRYFLRNNILFPARHAHAAAPAEIVWRPLTQNRAAAILRNPLYAGAYVYGRQRHRRVLCDGEVRERIERVSASDKWITFLRQSHEGYISWEEHMENRRRLDGNCTKPQGLDHKGAAKKGAALLQGLALCGRCGRRMSVVVSGGTAPPRYECGKREETLTLCWSVSSRMIDEKVVEIFLEAVAPPEIDLSFAVVKEVERQSRQVDEQWKLRLERLRYEARRAERQYYAVEPENRIVARTLESRWNSKLTELAQLEQEYEQARRARKLDLSAEDRRAIMALARDLPRVWRAPTTTQAERKQLVRLLVEDVALEPIDLPQRSTKVRILWKTGATTEVLVARPQSGQSHRTPPEVIPVIRDLAGQGRNDQEIAAALNEQGMRNGFGAPFIAHAVGELRWKERIPAARGPGGRSPVREQDERGRLSVRGVALRFGVTRHVVRHWTQCGILVAEREGPRKALWYTMTPVVEQRVQAALQAGDVSGKRQRPAEASGQAVKGRARHASRSDSRSVGV